MADRYEYRPFFKITKYCSMIKITKKFYKRVDIPVKNGKPVEMVDGFNQLSHYNIIEIPAYLEDAFRADFNFPEGMARIAAPDQGEAEKWLRRNYTFLTRLRYFLFYSWKRPDAATMIWFCVATGLLAANFFLFTHFMKS